MKTKPLSLFTLLLLTSLFFACNSADSSHTEVTAEAMPEEAMAEETEAVPAEVASPEIALIITHEVADFAAWKAKFDEHASVRQDASLKDWALLTGRDNPNLVMIIEKVGDIDSAKAFIQSEDIKAKMADAGVVGEPKIQFGEVEVMDQEAAKSSTVRLYVQHKVEDYDTWKAVFDSKADLHAEAGVSPVAVARNLDDKNDVIVVTTAKDFETLENFINNPDVQATMEEAGVVGEPTFSFMNLRAIEF